MRADDIARRDAVLEVRADCFGVKPGDMIAFKERVHDQLPVRRDIMRVPPEKMEIAHRKRVEILAKCAGMAEIRLFAGRKPDQPACFTGGQLAQAVFGFVEAGKGFRPRQADEAPVERIGPGMIGADEAPRTDGGFAFYEPGDAMAAHVKEHPCITRLVPRGKAEAVVRHRHVRFGKERRWRDHARHPVEQRHLFARKPARIGIATGRDIGGGIGTSAAPVGNGLREHHLPLCRRKHVHLRAILPRICR